jgi:16S rRNA (adenine1518-N6/adenine1519-N6)-dimethyltransferase|tara:strand:+ start:17541 stop:18332 length:792 start_codon:yes stop_codon:yes gene_type:complete
MSLNPNKRFGQNFLVDNNIIEKILESINPSNNEIFLEIGGGMGALTFPLLERLNKLNVVEIDKRMVDILRSEEKINLNVIKDNALNINLKDIVKKNNALRIVGNLPYNISTPLLFHLLEQREMVKDMHIMLQKEVVDRIVASPGNKKYGRVSVMVSLFCDTEVCFNVSPNSFYPIPKVWSTFIKLKITKNNKYNIIDMKEFDNLIRLVFSMRRKTLGRSLKTIMQRNDFISVDIDPILRPENLEISSFVKISNYLFNKNKKIK